MPAAVLLYGSKMWTLTQLDWRRLDSFHTRCQRRILHIRWHDHISNDEVLRRTGLLAALSIVRKRRLRLFGHVARLAGDVLASRIRLTYCECQDGARPSPDWRRARGRPPTLALTDLPGHGVLVMISSFSGSIYNRFHANHFL